MSKKKKILIVIAIIIALGAAFYGGMTYKSSNGSQNTQGIAAGALPTGGTMPAGGPTGGMPAGGPGGTAASSGAQNIRGTVLSIDEGSVVVQLADNEGSKIVMLSADTQILETKVVASDALTEGKSVMIMGTKNDDGTVTANNIMLREAGTEPTMPPPSAATSDSATTSASTAQ